MPKRAVLLVAIILFILGVSLFSGPTSVPFAILTDEKGRAPVALPYRENRPNPHSVKIEFSVVLDSVFDRQLRIRIDDCLDKLELNNLLVIGLGLPYCEYNKTLLIPLRTIGFRGKNTFVAHVRNVGGPGNFDVLVEQTAPFRLLSVLCIAFSVLITISVLLPGSSRRRFLSWEVALIAAGVLLRILYLNFVPMRELVHDFDGHIDYLRFAVNFAVPHKSDGWVLYHPPLYYWVSSLWSAGLGSLGLEIESEKLHYLFACAVSIATFLTGCLCIHRCRIPRSGELSALALLAFTGGYLSATTSINNDGMTTLLVTALFLFVLNWVTGGRVANLWAGVTAFSLGMISKTNAIIGLPLIALSIWRNGDRRSRLNYFIIAALIFFAITGWYWYARFISDGVFQLVGNFSGLQEDLLIPTHFRNFYLFNPAAIWSEPYVLLSKAPGNANLWEMLYRTVWFGEFHHGKGLRLLASVLAMLGFIPLFCLCKFLLSVPRSAVQQACWLLSVSCLLAIGVHRYINPASVSQNFRYIAPGFVAMAAGVGLGLGSTESKPLRTLLSTGMIIFGVCCALFSIAMVLRWTVWTV